MWVNIKACAAICTQAVSHFVSGLPALSCGTLARQVGRPAAQIEGYMSCAKFGML